LQRKPELLAKVLEYEPRAIMLSFGDISPFTDTIHKAGVPLFSQVQSVRGAREAVQKGADVIVAQGGEAGGHGAARGTFALIPSIRDAIGDTPLVAAGGIADGRGIAAALLLGADAVLCGTAFYVADESLANVKAKAVAVATTGDDTVRSTVFDRARGLNWPTPWTLRARNNAFHQKWQSSPDSITQVQCQSYAMASAAGDMETMAVIVGEAVDLVRTISPASMIISKMAYDAEKLLTAAPARSIFQMKDHVND
jgi:nitronate monooxygenase